MSETNLQTLLSKFGERVGIADLALDDDNYCMLRLDDALSLSIEFSPVGEQVIFTTRVGTLPGEQRNALLQAIAEANFHWAGTGGGTLSLNPQDDSVYLQFREASTQMDQQRFENLLQALVHNTERWAARLAGPAPAASAAPQIGSAPPFFTDRA